MVTRLAARNVRLKRAYARPELEDGTRILVDRLWPRGIARADAALDAWMKDIAPSTALRHWFAHDPERWQTFRARYAEELRAHGDRLDQLRARARGGTLTLVYSARDEGHNQAVALRGVLLR